MAAVGEQMFAADKLEGDNWMTWKYRITRVLKANGLFKYVDGSETLPAGASEAQRDTFRKRSDKALALIVTGIDSTQVHIISRHEEPVGAWNALETHFERNTTGNELLLKMSAKAAEECSDTDDCDEYTLAADSEDNSGLESAWFVDSGASRHMTKHRRLLENYKPFDEAQTVGLGDRRKVPAMGSGTVRLQTVVAGGETLSIMLKDVLYVPDLEYNLFSVRSANHFGGEVRFTGDRCHIFNRTGKLCGIGSVRGSLYKLKCQSIPGECDEEASVANGVNDIDLWHQRMGHLNLQQMKDTLDENLVTGVKPFKGNKLSFCSGCTESKLHRKPFKSVGEIKSTRTLQLVHSDMYGPMKTESIGGKRYFITFIDDYSRYCGIYFMKNKAEALDQFKKYENMVTNITGNRITVLRTDRRSEYMSDDFRNYLQLLGIEHELTVPNSPQQNGVAERMNRTLVASARTMICHANVPKSLWAEALYTAVYTWNRVPTSAALGNVTPHENWHGTKPNLKYFRVFGCIAYALSFDGDRKKLDKKTQKYRFVGYSLNSKGYRLLDDRTKKIVIRRDVAFAESCFKFEKAPSKEEEPSQFQIDLDSDPVGEKEPESSRPKRIINPPTRFGYDEYADIMTQTNHVAFSASDRIEPHHFKVKHTSNGEVDRLKVRLVSKGSTQKDGVDYNETFSPAARLVAIRTAFNLSLEQNMTIRKMDCVNLVCKLNKSLYGLKQLPRCWNSIFNQYVLSIGFERG